MPRFWEEASRATPAVQAACASLRERRRRAVGRLDLVRHQDDGDRGVERNQRDEFDHRRLRGMLQLLRARSGANDWNLDALEMELGRAHVVPREQVPATVVTMNSRVRVRDLDNGDQLVVSLVFPADRSASGSNVPVLSPLGLALLGCREGDIMEWTTPEGRRRLRLEAVIYQPEAQGEFFL